MKKKVSISIFMIMILLITSLLPAAATGTSEDVTAGMTLLAEASDDFDGSTLDASKWDIGLWYNTSSLLAFNDNNVSVKDGCLNLTAKRQYYNRKFYTAGAVESKFDVPGTDSYQRTYVEVRAKTLKTAANVLSAIWLQSSPLDAEKNPNPEIDMLETFGTKKVQSTLHVWPTDSDHVQIDSSTYSAGVDLSKDFHTYGLEREGNTLRFYFDGNMYWERNCDDYPALAQMSRHMVLSLEGHKGFPLSLFLPASFQIDYVHTYVQ